MSDESILIKLEKMNNNESCVISDNSSSEDDIDTSEDEDCLGGTNRDKRALEWCAVDSDKVYNNHPHRKHPHKHHKNPPKKVLWPPPSNSTPSTSSSNQWRFENIRMGNPKLGSKMQLYCQTGYHLAVYPDGTVRGTTDENDLHTYLEIFSAGYPGHVRIFALLTRLYVGMDGRGRLYGEVDPMLETTVFIESFQGSYNAYLSRRHAHLGWYIGIKRNGKIKKGSLTAYGQKAVKFLPRRQRFQ